MSRACGCLLLALFVAAGCSGSRIDKEPPPNILYILADDLGYADIGVYGQRLIETPHLDALASSGMRFTQHYAGSPVCAPSRCVLLTGLHSGHASIRANDEWQERGAVWDFARNVEDPGLEGQRPLPSGTRTIGTYLQALGYRTALVGKWGLGGPRTESTPNKQGFDFFFGYNCQRQAGQTYYPRHLWRNSEKVWLSNEMLVPGQGLAEGADPLDPDSYRYLELAEYAPELMLHEAIRFIEESAGQPFFLYYASPLPHVPLQAPRKWVRHYREKFGDEEPFAGQPGLFPQRWPHAAYAAMVSYLDDQVGTLIQRIDDLGLTHNTLVLFSSDNGPTFVGGADASFFESAAPFRGGEGWGKSFLREGGIRVPLIASWPGHIVASSVSEHVSGFYDVLPTLLDIAGGTVPEKTDGISFAPALLGRGGQNEHDFLYWEFPRWGGQQAVRMGRWKGLRRHLSEGNLDIELYDLESDMREEQNVADHHPEVVKSLRHIMDTEHVQADLESFHIPALGDR